MATKKQSTTVVGFVLDETGSMLSVQQATISGFNEYVDTLKQNELQQASKVLFTLVQFNSGKVETVHKALPIKDVPHLTTETYQPTNGTPLYDAVAQTIHDITRAAVEMKGNKSSPAVMLVIMTDGEENSSKEFNREKLFALIKAKEAEGWVFTFLGANQDAWAVGESIGFGAANSMRYNAAAPREAMQAAALVTMDYANADDDEKVTLRKRGLVNSRNAEEYLKSRTNNKT